MQQTAGSTGAKAMEEGVPENRTDPVFTIWLSPASRLHDSKPYMIADPAVEIIRIERGEAILPVELRTEKYNSGINGLKRIQRALPWFCLC